LQYQVWLFGGWDLENCSNFVRKKVVTYPRVDTTFYQRYLSKSTGICKTYELCYFNRTTFRQKNKKIN
jgi:hypothetical protein